MNIIRKIRRFRQLGKDQQLNGVAYLGPMAAMIALLVAVLLSYGGMPMEARPAQLDRVDALSAEDGAAVAEINARSAEMAVVYSEIDSITFTVACDVLDQMKIPYEACEAAAFSMDDLGSGVHTVLICTPQLAQLETDTLIALVRWVEDGGRMALMCAPDIDSGFQLIYRKLGVMEWAWDTHQYDVISFDRETLPFASRLSYTGFINDSAIQLRLEDDCRALISTGDDRQLPLMWTRGLGQGRLAVNNHNLIYGVDGRGYVLNTLSALEDTLIYPIINAGMIFIDDFPAPQPLGFDERLKEQFGYDVQGFFRNHWWPDMKALSHDLGLRYTGLLVETYNENVEGPYEPDSEDHSLLRYYTSELLDSGGEIGLHGYNHQPLCPVGFVYGDGVNYLPWPSAEAMTASIRELVEYGNSFLPEAEFTSYVPPSNYLSDVGWEALKAGAPDLGVISGLYLPDEETDSLVQEFREEDDGIISVPRISSGFSVNEYTDFVLTQELALHGVFSHFIHPDDVLDVERGAELGWETMYGDFSAMVTNIVDTCPPIRWCTASEGAAAVQRYWRVNVMREYGEASLRVSLAPFYDEVWLALWCGRDVARVENGELFEITDGLYWLRADAAQVDIIWEDAQ